MVLDTILEIFTIRTGKKIPNIDENPGLYLRLFNILTNVFFSDYYILAKDISEEPSAIMLSP
jgi:hypothetical protein